MKNQLSGLDKTFDSIFYSMLSQYTGNKGTPAAIIFTGGSGSGKTKLTRDFSNFLKQQEPPAIHEVIHLDKLGKQVGDKWIVRLNALENILKRIVNTKVPYLVLEGTMSNGVEVDKLIRQYASLDPYIIEPDPDQKNSELSDDEARKVISDKTKFLKGRPGLGKATVISNHKKGDVKTGWHKV